jgi:DNA cross-link repair 1A protein
MFLFRGAFGAVLHTGDFRLHPSMLDMSPLCGISLTHMILDTTYNDPNYSFPTQECASRIILDIVIRHRASGHRIIMGMDTVGKEELLLTIGKVACRCDERVRHKISVP